MVKNTLLPNIQLVYYIIESNILSFMKILVYLIFLLSLNIKSAEFTFEAYGVNNLQNSVVTES